ncbi:MAG: transglycosylase SLT domain-containing protein [Oligoflexales bacterium]
MLNHHTLSLLTFISTLASPTALYAKVQEPRQLESKTEVGISPALRTSTAPLAITKNPQPPVYKVSPLYINSAIEAAASESKVPPTLLRAICITESNLRPQAFVYNDGGNGNHAFGMCQVLLQTAKPFVGYDPKCERDFRDPELVRNYNNCPLFGPKVNAKAAGKLLRKLMTRHQDLHLAIASYNSGSPRTCRDHGWAKSASGQKLYRCTPGQLMNQRYVDKVMAEVDAESLASWLNPDSTTETAAR